MRRIASSVLALLLGLTLVACGPSVSGAEAPEGAQVREVILATTTSTADSSLLDVLLPDFERRTGYVVKPIAVGSGQALLLGERGEADVLLVHSPAAEEAWIAAGHGASRTLVMHNDFLLVGPPGDPAAIRGSSVADALRAIAASGAPFVSRGDESGTHARELALWQAAAIHPTGLPWYQETGSGMGQTLNVASEKAGYALTDRATYLALAKNLSLDILVEEQGALRNVYHVITVNPAKSPRINAAGARALAEDLVSPHAQSLIAGFGVERFGRPLFVPDAGKSEEQVRGGR